MSLRAVSPQEQRDHKALLLRNVRQHKDCPEHQAKLRRVFGFLIELKLPRIPRHKV